MARRDPERDPAAFLGEKLRQARLAAGYASQDALAAKLGFDRTVITKAESGDRPPSPDVLTAWCRACGLDEELWAGLTRLARNADGPVPTWLEDWLEIEGKAHTLHIWQPLIIPGLLQTPAYARELFLAAGADEMRAGELVEVRLERQSIYDQAEPPQVVAILDESALHRLIGSPAIMSDQVSHLASMAERPNVMIQIVPATRGANAGLGGGFMLASCDDGPDVLSLDTVVEDVTEERRPLARRAALIFDRVRGHALACEESRSLMLEVAEQWKSRQS